MYIHMYTYRPACTKWHIHTYIRICRCVSINRCPEQILKEGPMETLRRGLYVGFVSIRDATKLSTQNHGPKSKNKGPESKNEPVLLA